MQTSINNLSLALANSGSTDKLLAQLEYDMGKLFLPFLLEMLAFPDPNILAESGLIAQIEDLIPMVVTDLEALKNGTALDQEAYNSSACQNILQFLTEPQAKGFISIYQASLNHDNMQVASILFYLKYENELNSKSGLIGQIRIFLAEWPS